MAIVYSVITDFVYIWYFLNERNYIELMKCHVAYVCVLQMFSNYILWKILPLFEAPKVCCKHLTTNDVEYVLRYSAHLNIDVGVGFVHLAK